MAAAAAAGQVQESRATTSAGEDFDLATFADQLKRARQFGKLTQFGRGLPKGGEAIAQRSLERQEEILRKLSTYSLDGQRLTAQNKNEVAAQCSCTVRDVEDVLGKYEWTREANRRVIKLKEEGKPLPKSLDEIEKLMGGRWKPASSVNLSKENGGQQSRNSPCPCGSGKKYKRCCGKD
ncbi:hypothetical protein R1flu_011393 [Riccia fluitans]|uniref:Signal recognition particle SRP54 subunit M-domain domain-containing protein n=1 Tax=Riccia fluitans TaxID=41844 RepID=A0ABD1Z7N7_9MARC